MPKKEADLSKIEGFEWDRGNVDKSWKKHLVTGKEAEEVFLNKRVYFYDEKHSQKEQRYVLYGITNKNRKLIVVFTFRDSKIRIISARDQSRKEVKTFEKDAKL